MKNSMAREDTQTKEDHSHTKESKSSTRSEPSQEERKRISRGYPLPLFGAKKYLHDVGILIMFAEVLDEMELVLVNAKKAGKSDTQLKDSMNRMNKLRIVFDGFGGLFTSANFYGQKVMKVEKDLMEAYDAIVELKKENDKMKKMIDWKGDI